MTRIGFAYNQKPESIAGLSTQARSERTRSADKPPSTRRDAESRTIHSPASPTAGARGSTVAAARGDVRTATDDAFAEWDSPQTIDAIAHALSAFGDVIRLEATVDFPARLRHERPDIVFNIAEGLSGTNRESHVPAICEFFGIPYSGSDPFTLSLCLHKARAKELLSFHRIANAAFTVVENPAQVERFAAQLSGSGFRLPLFVKPIHEGSSKGITERNLVRTVDALVTQTRFLLETYDQPVLVEAFLPGAEFTCGVLGNGGEARVLPIVGVNFDSLPAGAAPIYGFEAKWVWDTPERPLDIFECPARIDAALAASIDRVVLAAYGALGCRDWARIDVRLDAVGTPQIVEVNPLPGILPNPDDNSCLPKAARAAGLDYDELIQTCLQHAAQRHGMRLRRVRRHRASQSAATSAHTRLSGAVA